MVKVIDKIKKFIYINIIKINDSPQRIALGFGLGIFCGIFPGVGSLAALSLAFILKANRASALLASLISNTWLSLITFLFSIKIGSVILRLDWGLIYQEANSIFSSFTWKTIFKFSLIKLLLPLILGYFIISIIAGLISYFFVLLILKFIKGRLKEEGMDIKRFILKKKRDFNLSLSMVGVIPFLVFTYLITVRLSTLKILAGQIGCIVFCTLIVFMLGIYVGKRMFRSMVDEIMEKNKQIGIAEAILRVGDKINNPLLAIRGNLGILEDYIIENKLPGKLIDRIKTIKDNIERIRQITDKASSLPNSESSFTESKKVMNDFIK
ncbi:MAG: DUF2062 domain-containing protein [Candidatus Omnitrophota bacterium]